jgi:hypothetical protein
VAYPLAFDLVIDPLRKPAAQLSWADVESIVKAEYPETSRLEFKEQIPAKSGTDAWHTGDTRIGGYGRNALLAEIVGFANAGGGLLLVGIKESKDEPHRAVGIEPVPRVAALAERLSQQVRDCIDPPLLAVDFVPLSDGATDQGVLAVQISASSLAPHRVIPTLECYRRVGTRKEKMDMRAIQDLSLARFTSSARLEERFEERARLAAERQTAFVSQKKKFNVNTIRVTCIPSPGQISLGTVYGNADLVPSYGYLMFVADGQPVRLDLPIVPLSERPILRGSRHSNSGTEIQVAIDVMADGLIEYHLLDLPFSQQEELIFPEWVLGLVAHALKTVAQVTNAARAPGVEYEIEVAVTQNPIVRLARFGPRGYGQLLGAAETGTVRFPRFSYVQERAFEPLRTVLEDLSHCCGVPCRIKTIELAPQAT